MISSNLVLLPFAADLVAHGCTKSCTDYTKPAARAVQQITRPVLPFLSVEPLHYGRIAGDAAPHQVHFQQP